MYLRLKEALRRSIASLGWEYRRIGPEYPPPVQKFLARARGLGLRPRTVFDVGAALGDFTEGCWKVFPEAQFFLIEPLDEFAPILTDKSKRIGATFVPAVAAEKDAEAMLHVHQDYFGSSLFREEEGAAVDGTERSVKSITIDGLASQKSAQGPYLLKADVQGAELRVLDGATSVLGEAVLVMLEVVFFEFFVGGPLFSDVVDYMADRGFVVYDMLQPEHRPLDGALAQMDLMFVPRESILRRQHIFATASQREAANERFRAQLATARLDEIAELLSVSHQRASKIVGQPGFPAPVGREGQRRLWDRREVREWAKRSRRERQLR
jgi:FkbM family methyltransferase